MDLNVQKIFICDGDKAALIETNNMVQMCTGHDSEIRFYEEPEKVLSDMRREKKLPGIILLDLNFGKNGGVETAKEIIRRHEEMPIIFTSESLDNVQDIFEVDPIFFLKKPIKLDLLRKALRKGEKKAQQIEEQCITIASRGIFHRIKCSNIYYAESSKRIITLTGEGETWTVYMKMDDLEKILPKYFLRCHKSYIVNMNQILSLSSEGIVLENGRKLPVSRAKYREAKHRFLDYFNGECNMFQE